MGSAYLLMFELLLLDMLRVRSVLDLLNLARQVASEVVIRHILNVVKYIGFCIPGIRLRRVEVPVLLFLDLLVLELPVMLDTLHGLVDILLREELPKALQLLLDLPLSRQTELLKSVLAHLIARPYVFVSKGWSQGLLAGLEPLESPLHELLRWSLACHKITVLP